MAAAAPFILVAEDEPAHAEAIRRAFEDAGEGVELRVTGTLQDYRQAVADRAPDLALVDVKLPDGRAMDLLTMPPEAGAFPVVVMTSFGNEQMAVEALKAGAIDYLAKSPETFANMPRVVRRALDQWDLIQRHKRAQERQKLAIDILQMLARPTQLLNIVDDLIHLIKTATGLDAVGLRLRDGDDFPYYVTSGFSEEFLRNESSLFVRGADGAILRDPAGQPILDCMCGSILCRRGDPTKAFFSEGGSFWTNSTTKLLASTTQQDRGMHTRNYCHDAGYESVALIPLQAQDEIVGMLQLNDRRRDRFTLDMIRFFEGMGASIGIALARQQAEHRLRQSEERFRTLVESVTDYTYRTTARDGQVANTVHGAGCLGVTGYYPDEFHADPQLWIRIVHPEDQPDVIAWADKVASGQRAMPLEHRLTHRNGEVRWIRNSVVLRHDDEGQYIGYEGLIQDITDTKRLQDKLAQAQKMEAIGQLAGGVAHDFRNQLTVIKGFGEMLLRRSLVKDEGVDKLKEILKAADRSTLLTSHLLAFSRKQTLQAEVVNLAETLAHIGRTIRPLTGEDICVHLDLPSTPCVVKIDPAQFQQALLNLVVNARDAMPKGGELTVGVSCEQAGKEFFLRHPDAKGGAYAAVTVSDTGCGMDEKTIEKIFEPFFTTKKVGEGTGLGLPLVYGFVKQSGGVIEVDSWPGKGATFRLFFPLYTCREEPLAGAKAAPQDRPGGAETILVVEDEAPVRRMMVESLQEAGYTVLHAADAAQAQAEFQRTGSAIDLLITDVVMPGGSGVDLVRTIRNSRPGMPVLYVSGYAGKELTRREVNLDPALLLTKPCSHDTLLTKVRRLLDASWKESSRTLQ